MGAYDFFGLQGRRLFEVGANSRLGAYSNKYGKSIKEHFVKKSSEPENPREFWNAYRLFLHGKTNQANDIIMKENYVVISDKREIAELFNAHFIQVA